MNNDEFDVGDEIIYIGGTFTCSVLQKYSGWYVILWNDRYLHKTEMLSAGYVEKNYVLVTKLGEVDDEDED